MMLCCRASCFSSRLFHCVPMTSRVRTRALHDQIVHDVGEVAVLGVDEVQEFEEQGDGQEGEDPPPGQLFDDSASVMALYHGP
jgi:hypothetical protein